MIYKKEYGFNVLWDYGIYYDVYEMSICDEDEYIDLLDKDGYVIGVIYYNSLDCIEIEERYKDKSTKPGTILISKNGRLVI